MSQRKKKVSNGVSTAAKNRSLDGTYVDHKKYVKLYRYHTMRVIKEIRKGIVNEEDIDRLQNFVQMGLALMDRSNMEDIDKAWRNAEAMSFIHADLGVEVVEPCESHEPEKLDKPVNQYSCVLDPHVQKEALNDFSGRTDGSAAPCSTDVG